MKAVKKFMAASVLLMLLTSCLNNLKEKRLIGKWQLIETALSTDGGIHFETFERYPAEESNTLILLEDGIALYTDGLLGVSLDSATWRVYSNGDSLEVHDEEHKYTGMYDSFRIQKLYKSIMNGKESEVMELAQTGENHSPLFGGASTVIILMRYEKVEGWSPDDLQND